MCMDQGSFRLVQNGKETAMDHVASILPGEGGLKLVDAFGKTEVIAGCIEEIDLLNRRIVVA